MTRKRSLREALGIVPSITAQLSIPKFEWQTHCCTPLPKELVLALIALGSIVIYAATAASFNGSENTTLLPTGEPTGQVLSKRPGSSGTRTPSGSTDSNSWST